VIAAETRSAAAGVAQPATDVLGARLLDDGSCAFRVWAPNAERVEVVLVDEARAEPLTPAQRGYHVAVVAGVAHGTRYRFRLDDANELPDPASRLQAEGVHGPSTVVDHRFPWHDHDWSGLPLDEYVIYELHVGTFSEAGTLDAAADRLGELRELGITAVELMPVAQFPGDRNWGYDGVYPYATQSSYGGPLALKRFVDRCHYHGLAAILDVVYNHLGPEGNYLPAFGPYFIDTYRTPWGDALNFDGPHSDEVRELFIRNALQWVDEFHFDALRLDAVHAIFDMSAQPFLQQLADRVHALGAAAGRHVILIAESDLGDPRMVRPREGGGLEMDAQWLDDFHHAVHTLLTHESDGYYADFGGIDALVSCLNRGFVYAGEYSRYRRRSHGAPAPDISPSQFVVCSQNHDQIGNRMIGDRLASGLEPAALRLAAATTILSPFTPLLFMGEEYGETAPFPYFVSHSDEALVEAVRSGRREEFAAFAWAGEPPDPQAADTFASARLRWPRLESPAHAALRAYYRELLRLRRELPRHRRMDSPSFHARAADDRTIVLHQEIHGSRWLTLLRFTGSETMIEIDGAPGRWRRLLDSAETRWGGKGESSPETIDADDGTLRIAMPPYAAIHLRAEQR
jgi:maltooligosyltrehalose trehalohydrolase